MPKPVRSQQQFWGWKPLGVLSLCLMLFSCGLLLPGKKVDNVNLLLGNPSAATTNITNVNNYLIVKPQYVLSYNRDKGIPNWVSWQLNQSWLGTRPRLPFVPDPSLPSNWSPVKPEDYTGSGFDRGHLTPAADRNRTQADSEAVFLMTNILPQSPDSNRGPWEELESYCRELTRQGKELYIVAGGTGSGGTGVRGRKTAIARGRVAVPNSLWKVIVVLDRPGLGLEGISKTTRIIAVIMPNRQGIKNEDWKQFRTSVDEIEERTGYDFLSNVSNSVEAVIEAKVDNQ